MSAAAPTASLAPSVASTAPKKKNNKKKKGAAKAKEALDAAPEDAQRDDGDVSDEPQTPVMTASAEASTAEDLSVKPDATTGTNGHAAPPTSNGHPITPASAMASDDATAKLDAMTKEREALRAEVESLRKQLESIRASHDEETAQLKTELDETTTAKDTAETQYQTLLLRVEKIKETLSDRLKRDKQELEEAKERIEELETQNEELQTTATTAREQTTQLREELAEATREVNTLRSRTNLSQQNWTKEKDEMAKKVAYLTAELESTSSAMGEWEVIAMEERSGKESLTDKVAELEEQLASLREGYESAAAERDRQGLALDSLQKALQDLQETRKKELREMVESSEEQLQALKKLVLEADARAASAEAEKDTLEKELERTAPFEKEVKEKNLLIGKLRHEAIVLNDHLTKALRYLKKSKAEDNVDRQVVTNYLLHFLTLDRSDPKRFQILQVMANYLSWTEEQREKAGLARPGAASTSSLRLPASPFHRTPSTPSLKEDFFSEPTPTSAKESLADLWASFLERSVEDAQPEGKQRKDSMSSVGTNLTRPDTRGP